MSSDQVAEGQGGMSAAVEVVFRVWQCYFCAHVYDEPQGDPEHGIAPGTRWEDVPEDWCCPDCGATKNDFAAL